MNKIRLIIGCLLISMSAFGQETDKIIQSVEASLELGLGGAIIGVQAKANHHWIEKESYTVLSGLSFSSFWSGVNAYTDFFQNWQLKQKLQDLQQIIICGFILGLD